jgi:hypothetical protein
MKPTKHKHHTAPVEALVEAAVEAEVVVEEKVEAVAAPLVVTLTSHVVEPATLEDHDWIESLWFRHQKLFGGSFASVWTAYVCGLAAGPDNTQHIDVVRPLGFHVYTDMHTGGVSRRAIATNAPRTGVGRALLSKLAGRKVHFCVFADNVESLAFHDAMGCTRDSLGKDSLTGKIIVSYAGLCRG